MAHGGLSDVPHRGGVEPGQCLSTAAAALRRRHCEHGHEKQFVEERVTERTRVLVGGVGIDPHVFTDRDGRKIRVRLGMNRGPVVGYVGRVVPSKGVAALIKAMRVVWQWNPAVRLMLAGPRTLAGMEGDREVELGPQPAVGGGEAPSPRAWPV
jgi:glycosyltransferase involved in cell wall biosynthesis